MKTTIPPTITFTIGAEELNSLSLKIEESIINRIEESPERFLPLRSLRLKLYTTEEVAKLLRLSDATVRNLCNNGQMKHMRPGGRNIVLSQEQLEQYLESIKSE